MDDKNSFFSEITGFEKSEERVKKLIAMLNKHTYGPEEEKKMDNDPGWIINENPKENGNYIITMILENNERAIATCRFENGWWLTEYVVEAWMPTPPIYVAPVKPVEKKRETCFRFTNGSCMVTSHDSNGTKTMASSTDPTLGCKHWDEKGDRPWKMENC